MRAGQKPNNLWDLGLKKATQLIKKLEKDKNYISVYKTKEQFIFVKKGKEFCFQKNKEF